MATIAKKVQQLSASDEDGLFVALMTPGGDALPIPEALAEMIAADGYRDVPDATDAAAFHAALGAAWVLAKLEEPFAPDREIEAIAIPAATDACLAYYGGPEVVA